MKVGEIIFVQVLLFLFIFTCNGAPPRGEKCTGSRAKFTEQEDNFIVQELLKLLDGSKTTYKKEVWEEIAEKHNGNRKANVKGFSKERSSPCLQSRFRKVLIKNRQSNKVKVPEALLQKIYQAHTHKLEQGGHSSHRFTKEETNFIFEQLRKLPSADTPLLCIANVEAIKKAHDEERLANTSGFQHVRTFISIRKQLFHLRRKGRMPEDIVQKYTKSYTDTTEASSSTSAAQTQPTGLQVDLSDSDIE